MTGPEMMMRAIGISPDMLKEGMGAMLALGESFVARLDKISSQLDRIELKLAQADGAVANMDGYEAAAELFLPGMGVDHGGR